MSNYFEKLFKLIFNFSKIVQKFQKFQLSQKFQNLRKLSIVIPLHPLERIFIFITTIYIISSISLITEILGDQINGYMRVSDWLLFLTIPGLIICSIITIYTRSIPHYTIFIIYNIIPILLYSSLINFIKNLCNEIYCSEHDGLLKISISLFSLSALFELTFISLGYIIWRKGIWKCKNEFEKAGHEKCHA
ncbi:unnamed protein product [Rhizophagus irregularis]|nr:unnamed protein product [Rhizophagus irregularis]CAB5388711.1 unnamed protein product [Rhizophagus irregularis]